MAVNNVFAQQYEGDTADDVVHSERLHVSTEIVCYCDHQGNGAIILETIWMITFRKLVIRILELLIEIESW